MMQIKTFTAIGLVDDQVNAFFAAHKDYYYVNHTHLVYFNGTDYITEVILAYRHWPNRKINIDTHAKKKA